MKRRRYKGYLIAGMFALFVMSGAFAYFTAQYSIDNRLNGSEAKVYLNELFDPNDKWVPGEEKQKEVRFGNEGKIASVMRAKFTQQLKRKDGTADPDAVKGFSLNFSDKFREEWEQIGDWYYYKKVLEPGQMTDITLKSVTISNQIGNDEHQIAPDYSQAEYDVKIEGELIQASAASEGASSMKWGAVPQVTGDTVVWTQG